MKLFAKLFILFAFLPWFAGCSQQEPSLEQLLQARKDESKAQMTPEQFELHNQGIQDIIQSKITDNALKVGDIAPDFTLRNPVGEKVSLYEELKKGPVILTWYRGNWCPYCNITLSYLQQELPNFKKEGAILMALTPEVPDETLTTRQKHELEFAVLSDLHNKIADRYGIVFKVSPKVAKVYQEVFALHEHNGDSSDELPLPATFIIKQDHTIGYVFVDADYRKRAEPKEILNQLKALK